GEAKAGFCSIVNGEITVGVSDATPMLEQALSSDGYFFRQYPLVVGGQLVENRPKGRALRKALAELDGHISVIASTRRLTLHDFSQALIDLGVRNAIYLVGSSSTGLYTDADGRRTIIGQADRKTADNVNFIVWR
nr:phosphodiester glycosidase family protein [Muribaculaceae bacterium]